MSQPGRLRHRILEALRDIKLQVAVMQSQLDTHTQMLGERGVKATVCQRGACACSGAASIVLKHAAVLYRLHLPRI
eukprot:5079947-Pleurochrysis_carterae.AAC.2